VQVEGRDERSSGVQTVMTSTRLAGNRSVAQRESAGEVRFVRSMARTADGHASDLVERADTMSITDSSRRGPNWPDALSRRAAGPVREAID